MKANNKNKVKITGKRTFRFVVPMDKETLIDFLKSLKGSQFVSIVAHTVPDMSKTDNPYFGHVVKVTKANGLINSNWETAVDNFRKRNGMDNMPAHKNQGNWWTAESGALVKHAKDASRKYLRFLGHRFRSVYIDTRNGQQISLSDLLPFLHVNRDKTKPIFNVYSVDNLKLVRARGIEIS